MQQTDIIIIGGGILGLATAYQFSREYPRLSITVLELSLIHTAAADE